VTARPDSPLELLRSLPQHLGRQPRIGELVLIGWSPMAEELAVVVTLPLADAEPREELAAVRQLVIDGAEEAAAVLLVPREEIGLTLGVFLGAVAARYGLQLLDAVTVHPDAQGVIVWRSLSCTDPGCCPPEGTPLPWPLKPSGQPVTPEETPTP
jgi:hypothetical protein